MYNYIKRALVLAEGEVEGMKKRYLLIVCVLLSTLLLTSCGVLLRGFLGEDRDSRLADKATNDLCSSIKDRDKATVKNLFSEKARSDADDIDAQIEKFFSFIDGEVLSWERTEYPDVAEDIAYGEMSKWEWFWFSLKTSKDVYAIYLTYCLVDDFDSENKGIYGMLVVRAADKDRLEDWSEMPGINIQRFQDETQESTRTAVPLGG